MDKRELLTKHFSCKNKKFPEIDCEKRHVNLKHLSCEKGVLQESHLERYIDLEFIPWKRENDIVFIAAHRVTEELFTFLKAHYNGGFRVFTSSKENIILSIQRNFSYKILSHTINHLKDYNKKFSAHSLFKSFWGWGFLGTMLLVCFFLCKNKDLLFVFMIFANIIFFINILFKVVLFFCSKKKRETGIEKNEKKLPRYTIIVPLYKEDHAIPNLIKSLKRIQYPSEKLEIIFVVEQFDRRTLRHIGRQKNRSFRVICVPKGGPQTKPKACSYVLNYVRGDYLVIYDAEDSPAPDQLLKAVYKFKNGDKKLACLQGRLNFYNSSENVLTSFFTIEYFCWFNIFLKGLLSLKMPIPLGGSSNHFKVDVLKKVGGWDPYNVTEDADLGYRLFKEGYKVDELDSLTLEEAPFCIKSWLAQRTRWIRGHLQTYFVHLRTGKLLREKGGKRASLGFHFFLFLPIVSYIFHGPLIFFLFFVSGSLKKITILNYFLWQGVSFFLAVYSYKNCPQKMGIKGVLLYSFYYFLHSIAAFLALYKLFLKPHIWEKTEHDFYKRKKVRHVTRDLLQGCKKFFIF